MILFGVTIVVLWRYFSRSKTESSTNKRHNLDRKPGFGSPTYSKGKSTSISDTDDSRRYRGGNKAGGDLASRLDDLSER